MELEVSRRASWSSPAVRSMERDAELSGRALHGAGGAELLLPSLRRHGVRRRPRTPCAPCRSSAGRASIAGVLVGDTPGHLLMFQQGGAMDQARHNRRDVAPSSSVGRRPLAEPCSRSSMAAPRLVLFVDAPAPVSALLLEVTCLLRIQQ
jgi:hypothetical protein